MRNIHRSISQSNISTPPSGRILTLHWSQESWGNGPAPNSACTLQNWESRTKKVDLTTQYITEQQETHPNIISILLDAAHTCYETLPGSHKIHVTGGVMIGKVSSKLWNSCFVVEAMLRVELNISIDMEKHQLQPNAPHCKWVCKYTQTH